MAAANEIGEPFALEETALGDALARLPPFTAAVADPPWSSLAPRLPRPARLIMAGDLALDHLEARAAQRDAGEAVVGIGGGAALDTAKFLSLRTGKPLVLAPTIVSVDAAFTDAAGVRVDGKVRYLGRVRPDRVILDMALVRGAPPHLNRAGAGDILSCATALFDWSLAADRGQGPAWDAPLAALGRRLLDELEVAAGEVRAVSEAGVRFLSDALRRIGAACAAAGHSRFEEGSEHFLAYAIEHQTGRAFVHGELVALCAAAMSAIQGGAADRVARIIAAAGVRAHPAEVGVSEDEFRRAVASLPAYVRREALDFSIVDLCPPDPAAAWAAAAALPCADRPR